MIVTGGVILKPKQKSGMRRNFIAIIAALPVFFSFSGMAQQTVARQEPAAGITTASDLFNKEKYGSVRDHYSMLQTPSDLLLAYDVEKDYYTAVSAAELQHADAPALLKEFLEKHPENTRTNRVWFQLGNLYFRNNSFRSALDAYQQVDKFDMNTEEQAEFTFKQGYCHFKQDDFDKAADAFYRIKEQQTRYTGPATYYYAHIMYADGKYETALRDFQKLGKDETFKSVVPYYIIQIYYMQGRYDELLELARPYLKGQRNKRTNEILRLVADVNYKRGNFQEAINLLEEYRKLSRGKFSREESYILAYSYYKTGEFEKAIPEFQQVAGGDDSLSQNAWYHLGDSYLKTSRKQFASNAFLSAWKVPVKSALAEDALFNYAKLSIELSYNPYNEAIRALQQYLAEYPSSPRRDEAYTYLANLYLVTRNYREALSTLENVKKRTPAQNEIYQKITYYRGLELFADNQFFDAIGMFKKSAEHKSDELIAAGATFWAGESYYRLGQYDQAAAYYRNFQNAPGAKNHTAYASASYNLGYAMLKQKNYSQAAQAFSRFIESRPADKKMMNDARLRLADAFFMQKQYQDAIAGYDQVIGAKTADADYALYQKSLAVGVTGNIRQKIVSLQKLLNDFPRSPYNDDARFEIGQAQMTLNQNEEALQTFRKLVADHPNSSFVKRSLLNTGLIYYNTNRNQQALETFKKVVKDYPATPESREALAVIKNIYVDMNQVDAYVNYSQDIPFANITRSEQDSLTFIAVEGRYMAGDCSKAIPGFSSYLDKFPNGIFSVKANYFKADCESRAGNHAEALKSYEFILSKPRTGYTENSALKAAEILFRKKDYAKALQMYERLEENAENPASLQESYLGQMRCNFYLGNHGIAVQKGQKVLETERLSPNLAAETHLITGKSYMSLQRYEAARTSFENVMKLSQGEAGAEALFNLAAISYEQKDYTAAESQIFKLSGDYASYDYWVARSFILLSDVYIKTGNVFQARQTLQSIIDNYEGEDLRKIAADKLERINHGESSSRPTGKTFDDEEGIIIR